MMKSFENRADLSSSLSPTSTYRGRFAPSPTGALHLGSLIAALGSYMLARQHGGQWLVRMEDLDPPREQPGAADDILHTLECFGLHWDEKVLYQSQRGEYYAAALQQLRDKNVIYPCTCSRRQVADQCLRHGIDGPVYPGTCRHRNSTPTGQHAWRLRVEDRLITFEDDLQGPQQQNLDTMLGDFVLRRADGFYAYQLAVVVDDEAQKISHIVRGADLLDSTPRQIYLQQCLDYKRQTYLHLPIARNQNGEKLSKQTRAPALDKQRPSHDMWLALVHLGQQPPEGLRNADLSDLWAWVYETWDDRKIPRVSDSHVAP